MRRRIALFGMFLISMLMLAETGEEILAKADAKLFPASASYKLSVEVENDDGKLQKDIWSGIKKGSSKNIMVLKEPKKNAGTVQLRRENSIWMYFSTNGKTMKTAFQSLTMGEAVCYGDLLASDLSYDYDVTEIEDKGMDVILTLRPKPKHEGYAKLVVTIEKKSFITKKREYYAISGTLLKLSEIKETQYDENGVVKYFKQEFYDPLKERKNYVTMENIKAIKESDIAEKYYNESQMKFFNAN